MRRSYKVVWIFSGLMLISNGLSAKPLPETMAVKLIPLQGEAVTVAQLQLKALDKGEYEYQFTMDKSLFSDHFLSMRPFKCLTAPQQMLCHLPYPYPKGNRISAQDMRNLEYDLLFIHRQSSDYGIDPWNGVYYQLALDEEQGKITGEVRAVDLDILASPPEAGVDYPIGADDLNETTPEANAFPQLEATAPAVAAESDPLKSPQWEAMHTRFLNGEAYTFDDKVKVEAPTDAEDSLNVPIAVHASGLDGIQEMRVIADLNPLPQVLTFRPKTIAPSIAFRMKLQQGSPVRVAAKTADGLWHVGGVYVNAAGGGCTLPSVGTSSGDWSKTLGRVSANVWQRPDNNRLRIRVMHPMDTGLANGIPTFHLENLKVNDGQGNTLAELDLFEPISENPMLSLDVGKTTAFKLEGHDNNGNRIAAEVVE